MPGKGTTVRPLRIADEVWAAATAAFPPEPGRESGVSAEVRAFVRFLAEHPDEWKAVKAAAAEAGATPWQLVADAVR